MEHRYKKQNHFRESKTVEVRTLANSDVYYTKEHWNTKFIEGIEFISVVRYNPDTFRGKQNGFWINKEGVKLVTIGN